MATVELDAEFLALPLEAVRSAALDRARALGCEHAEIRVERIRSQVARLRDGRLETSADDHELGLGLRVVHDGAFGFAATVELTSDAAGLLADQAVATARATAPAVTERVELAEEPSHGDRTWASSYRLDPTEVPMADKVALLEDWSGRVLRASGVDHVTRLRAGRGRGQALCRPVRHASPPSAGSACTRSSRPLAVDSQEAGFETMRIARPAGRTRLGVRARRGLGLGRGARTPPRVPGREDARPDGEPGAYDLVIDPTNLWLTIHESIGHATELDRAMGYEAAYAGTSFATFDKLGSFALRLPGHERDRRPDDRRTDWPRSAIDDEGVEAQSFDLIARRDPRRIPARPADRPPSGLGRSNGCAFADSPVHIPIQRMANVSLQPAPGPGPSTEELIVGVEHGFYVLGDKSWSIDMQRYNFQFTGQRFFRIEHGRLAGQVSDVAYQATHHRVLGGDGGRRR